MTHLCFEWHISIKNIFVVCLITMSSRALRKLHGADVFGDNLDQMAEEDSCPLPVKSKKNKKKQKPPTVNPFDLV